MAELTLTAAFTSLCEEDVNWLDQYLAEVTRLDVSFAMHFDRCSPETKRRVTSHPNCVGMTQQDDPYKEFEEWDKQAVLDLLTNAGFDWALAWDVDETWEADAPSKLQSLPRTADLVLCRWWNLWGDSQHIRIDRHYGCASRVKLYNMQSGRRWKFDHKITNGAKLVGKEDISYFTLDLSCLHWGMMTQEMREFHRRRWDRIYSKAVGANPYGFWNDACDETIPVHTIRHGYF